VHAEASACRNNLKKYASVLVKSNDNIFGDPPVVQPSNNDQNASSPPEGMWTIIQQKIADLLDEGKYLNGPLDPAVSP
jgi:hypothetical protein